MSTRKSIRITLRLGIRTDEQLWRELEDCRPYARAKHVRRLMADGLRWRARVPTSVAHTTPSLVSPLVQDASASEAVQDSTQTLDEDIWQWQKTSKSIQY